MHRFAKTKTLKEESFLSRNQQQQKLLLQQEKMFAVMEKKFMDKFERMEKIFSSKMNSLISNAQIHQQHQQQFLIQLQQQQQQFLLQQQQQFLLQQQQQQPQNEQQQPQEHQQQQHQPQEHTHIHAQQPDEQQLHAQQPHEQQQQQQSSTHPPQEHHTQEQQLHQPQEHPPQEHPPQEHHTQEQKLHQPQEHPPQEHHTQEQQLHAQQPDEQQLHEQQQQQQSSTHQPLFSLFDHPFSIPSEVSSYLGLLQNDDPDTNTITTLNPQKKLPSRAKNLAMAVFLGIKDAFPSDVLLKSTLTAKGKLGQLDVHKVNFIKQKTLVQLGATREDWFICQPRLKELLREHRKKLSKMSKMS